MNIIYIFFSSFLSKAINILNLNAIYKLKISKLAIGLHYKTIHQIYVKLTYYAHLIQFRYKEMN